MPVGEVCKSKSPKGKARGETAVGLRWFSKEFQLACLS